jgi:hypothetical protein
MLRKISLITLFVVSVLSLHAQGVKFGVHIDPGLSFMNSIETGVNAKGANFNFAIGVEGEYYFSDGENYSITFGANFGAGRGGKLQYESGGKILPKSNLETKSFFSNLNPTVNPSAGTDLNLAPNTNINYFLNYVELPVGFKLRTNELGQSYLRAFFHLPVLTFMVPVSAEAKVESPDPTNNNIDCFYSDKVVTVKNIYSDIIPFQMMLGAGAGVEFSPNQEGGLRLIGGFYYNYGFIDTINESGADKDANSGFHNIGLRLGVIF